MGNRQTNLSIDKYFEVDENFTDKCKNSYIIIVVNLNKTYVDDKGEIISKLVVVSSEEGFNILPQNVVEGKFIKFGTTNSEGEIFENKIEINHHFFPRTHMRDFEVLKEDYKQKIERGKGVGVIILKNRGHYIKIFRDNDSYFGFNMWTSLWSNCDDAKEVLNDDLEMGWDVMLCTNNETILLCEELDERDD